MSNEENIMRKIKQTLQQRKFNSVSLCRQHEFKQNKNIKIDECVNILTCISSPPNRINKI